MSSFVDIQALITACRSSCGTVYLVGAGPGDPQLLTLRAARLLAEADVIVYDHLVGPEVLSLAGAHSEKVYVGKQRNGQSITPFLDELAPRSVRYGSAYSGSDRTGQSMPAFGLEVMNCDPSAGLPNTRSVDGRSLIPASEASFD